ncbi:Uroporphyrinogen-III synthase [Candidatus Paraburkholderia calva]|nr:Uroporphyrinogen-III synthase [Candidatus Paraburkholderia calva]
MASERRATIVVTRPVGQSAALIERLHEAGFETLEFPLIDIAPVEDEVPLRAALDELYGSHALRYALVVFVSPNAIDKSFITFIKLDARWPVEVPVAVVGPGSIAALARNGVREPAYTIISPSTEHADPRFDSEALYAAIEAYFGESGLAGKRVLIVRGDGGREWLAERMTEAGAGVEKVAAYRRVLTEPSMQKWERIHALLLGDSRHAEDRHAWLLTSSEGVRNLDELAREHLTGDEIARLKRASIVCPHPRITEAARQTGFDTITVSGAGDERIVESIDALFPRAAGASAQTSATADAQSASYARASTPTGARDIGSRHLIGYRAGPPTGSITHD